jgi:membrane fusion protein, adhesin transport system
MLNISNNEIKTNKSYWELESVIRVEGRKSGKVFIKIMGYSFLFFSIILFIPWTQNVRTDGSVTALKPEQRPQSIQSVIDGRIEKWYVQEGDIVKKGDTILFISETKDEYFDPKLLDRTQEQLNAKSKSVVSYMEKVKALDNQIEALIQTGRLKLEQARNKLLQARLKVQSDSMDFKASIVNLDIALKQLERTEKLYEQGLKSLTELESRKLQVQKTSADKISAENKLLSSRNEVINAEVEINSINAQYSNSVAKAESEKYTALSDMYDTEANVTKLQNQYANYSIRTGMYFITSPIDGIITKAIQAGIGENVKQGQEIVSLMPQKYDLAVEMFVRPIDLPLLEKGQPVRIQFDGWPAIIFSGWPNTSYGTYGGKVYVVDNFISPNGYYRVLVVPDPKDHEWPTALRVGSGTNNMLLLKDVPIWYELWRKFNGFPPDYYKSYTKNQQKPNENEKGK